MDYKAVVRVAVNNNFNCTEKEYAQLDALVKKYPQYFFFTNSNVKTPALSAINDHPYRAVITINPDLTPTRLQIERLYGLKPDKVAAVRVKWLPYNSEIRELLRDLSRENYTTVVTLQRFVSKKMLGRYTDPAYYEHSCSRYRLAGDALAQVEKTVDELHARTGRAYICDRRGLGCGGCGLCSELTVGKSLPIKSLNLSSSGLCRYSCPDCYAKENQIRTQGKIHTDVVYQNHKQLGITRHILEAKEALNGRGQVPAL